MGNANYSDYLVNTHQYHDIFQRAITSSIDFIDESDISSVAASKYVSLINPTASSRSLAAEDSLLVRYSLLFLNPKNSSSQIKAAILTIFDQELVINEVKSFAAIDNVLGLQEVTYISSTISDRSPTSSPTLGTGASASNYVFSSAAAVGGISAGGLVGLCIILYLMYRFSMRKVIPDDSDDDEDDDEDEDGEEDDDKDDDDDEEDDGDEEEIAVPTKTENPDDLIAHKMHIPSKSSSIVPI